MLSDDHVRRMRTGAQLLHRPSRRSAVELVRHLTGVQAQVLAAAGLALRARTNRLTSERVDHARLRDRSVVLTWVMRGTVHLIASEDYAWLVPLTTEPSIPNAHRRLKEEGVSGAEGAKALPLISQMLGREGPLTRGEIADRLQRRGIPTKGQAIAHLVWLAAAQGAICYGPDRDGDKSFVLVKDWLPKSKPRERDASLVELAIRYLRSHAPASPADLAYWSGIRAGDATRAWKAIAARLAEVETARGTRWVLKGQMPETPRSPILSPEGERETEIVRLLPAFDEYLLGWKDRDVAVAAEHQIKINRGGGWLHPVVLVDGRLVATWRSTGSRLEVSPFAPLTATVKRAIAREAEDIAAFIGAPLVLGA